MLLSEYYRNRSPLLWYADIFATAAIWVRDIVNLGVPRRSLRLWSLSESVFFDALKDEIRNTEGRVLVGWDFNARVLKCVMWRANGWITKHGFSLPLEKINLAVLTKERVPTFLPIKVHELMVLPKPTVKHLGIMINTKIYFFEHIRNPTEEAAVRCLRWSILEVPYLVGIVPLLVRSVCPSFLFSRTDWDMPQAPSPNEKLCELLLPAVSPQSCWAVVFIPQK